MSSRQALISKCSGSSTSVGTGALRCSATNAFKFGQAVFAEHYLEIIVNQIWAVPRTRSGNLQLQHFGIRDGCVR
jgi:hypothetical protein